MDVVDFQSDEVSRGSGGNATMENESSIVHHVSGISQHEEQIIVQSSRVEERDFTEERVYWTSTPNVGRTEFRSSTTEKEYDADCTFSSVLDDTLTNGRRALRKCVTLLQCLSKEKDGSAEELEVDTLENHLFPDMSYTESAVIYDNEDAQFKTKAKSPSKWSKLYGVTYLTGNSSLLTSDEDNDDVHESKLDVMNSSINHPNRSHFRQRRREWYLNRRNASKPRLKQTIKKKTIKHSYSILTFLISIYTMLRRVTTKACGYCLSAVKSVSKTTIFLVASPIAMIISLFRRIYIFVCNRVSSFLYRMFSLTRQSTHGKEAGDKSDFRCSGVFCWLLIVIMALGLLSMSYVDENGYKLVPNPHTNGIDNAHTFYVDSSKEIPAWHIFPKQTKLSPLHAEKMLLKSSSPVIMFLRKDGEVNDTRLKSIYDTMFSLGYHVIVPTDVIPQSSIIKTWKWIKDQTNATAYLWGFGIDATILTETAKVLCKHLFPPNGVIIAKEVKSENLPQTMEIWSCNCALAQSGNSSASNFKYNHIKCPLAFDGATSDVYSQVVHCIETVNKDMD